MNGHLIATVSPDLIIDGALLEAGLEGNLGGLRYLGQGPDGGHILLREEVVALEPTIQVSASIEWYSGSMHPTGSARLPGLQEQFIPVAPTVSIDETGSVWVLTTTSTHLTVSRVYPDVESVGL